jgi:hypothetical protein
MAGDFILYTLEWFVAGSFGGYPSMNRKENVHETENPLAGR